MSEVERAAAGTHDDVAADADADAATDAKND